jgi:hypothetical protein
MVADASRSAGGLVSIMQHVDQPAGGVKRKGDDDSARQDLDIHTCLISRIRPSYIPTNTPLTSLVLRPSRHSITRIVHTSSVWS